MISDNFFVYIFFIFGDLIEFFVTVKFSESLFNLRKNTNILFGEYSFFFQLGFADFANSAYHQINANKATSQAQLRGILFITFFEG